MIKHSDDSLLSILFFWLIIGMACYVFFKIQAHVHAKEDKQTTAIITSVQFDDGFFLAHHEWWLYDANTPFGICHGVTYYPINVGNQFKVTFFREECSNETL